MPAPIHEGHDKAAKRLLRDTSMMADALTAFVPGHWVADIDLGTLRLLPAEHVDAELRRRRGDLLWSVQHKGGGLVVFPVEAPVHPGPAHARPHDDLNRPALRRLHPRG